jgi:antitoxin YefM
MIDVEAAYDQNVAVAGSETRLHELVAGVQEREEEVLVTKNGRPAAILMNIEECTCFKEMLDDPSDPALMGKIAESRAFYRRKNKGLSFEDVFSESLTPNKKRRLA